MIPEIQNAILGYLKERGYKPAKDKDKVVFTIPPTKTKVLRRLIRQNKWARWGHKPSPGAKGPPYPNMIPVEVDTWTEEGLLGMSVTTREDGKTLSYDIDLASPKAFEELDRYLEELRTGDHD